MSDIRTRALQKTEMEGRKWVRIMLAAVCIALRRGWRFGTNRLHDLLLETQSIWAECAEQENVSILMMLEEATGIELKPTESSPSYHDLVYLNGTPKEEVEMSNAAYCYMRAQQSKWMGTMMEAAMFLALYRCMDYGFSADMLVKLVKLVTEVRSEFKDDKKKLWRACQEETGINLMEYERKGVIE